MIQVRPHLHIVLGVGPVPSLRGVWSVVLDVPGNLLLDDHLAAAMAVHTLSIFMSDFCVITERIHRLRSTGFRWICGYTVLTNLAAVDLAALSLATFAKLHGADATKTRLASTIKTRERIDFLDPSVRCVEGSHKGFEASNITRNDTKVYLNDGPDDKEYPGESGISIERGSIEIVKSKYDCGNDPRALLSVALPSDSL